MARTARWRALSARWRESQEPVLRTGRGQGRGPFRVFGTIGSESGPNRHDQAFAGAVIRFLRFLVIINRQELDSMIRVIYLLSVSDRDRRARLISDAVHGRIWRHPTAARVTDREMLELAERLHGWARSVYRFGCAFIHLSSLHDYRERDPVLALPQEERDDLIDHLRAYHGGPPANDATFEDVVPYLPAVFEKVASNLDAYLEHLARNERLEHHELEGAV